MRPVALFLLCVLVMSADKPIKRGLVALKSAICHARCGIGVLRLRFFIGLPKWSIARIFK
jgi:hypothetical protein